MTGILLIQLGTPDAPTAPALKRYLRQFLGDPRVIESAFVRRVIVPLFVLPRRPTQSAVKYQRIWDAKTGSPLLHFTRRQAELLQLALPGANVQFGMQVGNPDLGGVVRSMIAAGVERLIAVPMYPQYSATTTASATDALFAALQRERCVPALRIAAPYYSDARYLDTMEAVVRDALNRLPREPEHFIVSFHGLPEAYVARGDPYPGQCKQTADALAQRLAWPRERWTMTYQSRFGRDEWLKPYTDDVLASLATRGTKRVFVVTPGFTADCLETIDEIGHESAAIFREAGGDVLDRCPCLNDHPKWIEALAGIVREEGSGWFGG
jgi:protoporphyrin/coproporphyrin ferrochelatase